MRSFSYTLKTSGPQSEAWGCLSCGFPLVLNDLPESRLRSYIDAAPQMVRHLNEHSRLRYRAIPGYADYYQDLPGAKTGLRSMDPEPFRAGALKDEFVKLREQSPGMLVFGRMTMTTFEAHTLMSRSHGWRTLALRMGLRYWAAMARTSRSGTLVAALMSDDT